MRMNGVRRSSYLMVITLLVPACGGSGGGESAGTSSSSEIGITSPTTGPTWSVSSGTVTLGGWAAIDAYNSSDWSPHVSWWNSTSGATGAAQETVDWVWLFGNYPTNHRWTATVPLVGGPNAIVIEAISSGSVVGSALITVTAPPDTVPPTVQITSPTSDPVLVVGSPSVSLGGTASDDRFVMHVTWSNASTGTTGTASGTDTWTAEILLAQGTNPITVTATDGSGLSGQASISVVLDESPPTVTIQGISMSASDTLHAVLSGTAQDDTGVASVVWRNVSTGGSGTAAGTTSWTAAIPVQVGTNAILVTATDGLGHSAQGSTTVAVNPEVAAQGDNSYGQLGTGTTTAVAWPVATAISGVKKVVAGQTHSLALLTDGTVVAWGSNTFGELGNGSTSPSALPVPVPGLSGIRDVDAGSNLSFALMADGTVVAWGGSFGLSPVPVQGLSGVASIAAGPSYLVALVQDGTVRTVVQSVLEDPGLQDVIAISASDYYCVAQERNTLVWAWSPAGLPYRALRGALPVQVPFPNPAVLGRGGCSGISTDGTVKVWFADNDGMSPGTQVPVLTDVVAVDVQGCSSGAALRSDGTIWTWTELLSYDPDMHPSVIQFTPGPGLDPAFTPARGLSRSGGHLLVLRTP